MNKASISETKNRLSALLDRVRHGETILIMDRETPVARLEPVVAHGREQVDGRVARLERAGLLRRGNAASIKAVLASGPPKAHRGGDVLDALLRERAENR
ncbi:MAG: hypothetical protein A2138_18275 [Deltaproteobacteria bacterium RBG_16_71_12]|nr:MAG: hypothetical protein A2138_18275 [Deltaproteobacteria bacterium RBG_16_71_12]